MSTIDTDGIVNSAYHGGVVGIITVMYNIAARKVFGLKQADLGKLDVNDRLKLTATVGSALMTQTWLVKQGILPKTVMNPPAYLMKKK